MKILVNERLSKHRYKTPEGYLICTDAILARTGKQTYRKNEIFADSQDDSEIEVDRPAEEVFSKEAIASFENKPLANEHPDEDITPVNYKDLAVGFVRDVHRGTVDGQDVLLGTIVITDKEAIDDVESGLKTDLSCGYDCDIADEANPCQRNIRGNHVALCERGRAGIARIVDSKCKDFDDTGKNIRVVKEFIERNGNKFDKRKDADAILEYIKKRTGIANADYGDVLYIIKEYTRAEITDSVKDANYVIMHPRKNLYLTVGAKTWSDESDPMIKKFDSEKEAEEYAKKNTSDFKIAVFDSVKDVSALEFDDILDLFERKGIDYSDADDELKYIWFRNNNMYDKAVQELRRQRYSFKEATNKRGTKLLKLDSVKDAQSSRLGDKDSFKPGDKVHHVEGDVEVIDKIIYESTFSGKIVKKYVMKSGRKYLAEDIETDHWHKMTDDAAQRRTADSMKDTREIKAWALYKGQTIVGEDENATVLSVKGNNRDGYDVEVKLSSGGKDTWYFMSNEKVTILDESPVYDAWDINDDVYVNVGDGIYHHAKLISKEGNGAFNACVVKDLVTGKTIKTVMNRLRLFTKDPTHDALIPPTKEAINKFESLLRTSNIEIERKGLTTFGRVHYQVRAFMQFNQFVKKLNLIDDEMNKLGIPMTFNAGADDEVCTAGIDLNKQYVKDSQRAQKIQKIIKVVKSIK